LLLRVIVAVNQIGNHSRLPQEEVAELSTILPARESFFAVIAKRKDGSYLPGERRRFGQGIELGEEIQI
jgi:hypothetical protein